MNRTFSTFAALGVSVFVGFTVRVHAQTAPSVRLQLSAGAAHVTVTGPVNSAWTVQFKSALGKTNTWLPLANLRLTNGTALADDISGPVSGNKFYRAAPQQSAPTNVINTNLVWVAPGTFLMGCPTNEVGREVDEVQHPVTISRGFFVSKYLVTQGDFLAIMGYNPSYFTGVHGGTDLSRPIEQVHWYAAAAYCSQLTQTEQQAGRMPTNWVYRLPTEAEWEYACRAGSTNRFSYGDDPGYVKLTNYSWNSANSALSTHDVAQKLPNALGLYDVHGDVYEWCQDWYDAYPSTLAVDPQGPANGFLRVFRGGSWAYGGQFCRSAGRYSLDPTLPQNFVGIRIVAAPSP